MSLRDARGGTAWQPCASVAAGPWRWRSRGSDRSSAREGRDTSAPPVLGSVARLEREVLGPPHRAIDRRSDLLIRPGTSVTAVPGLPDDGDRDRPRDTPQARDGWVERARPQPLVRDEAGEFVRCDEEQVIGDLAGLRDDRAETDPGEDEDVVRLTDDTDPSGAGDVATRPARGDKRSPRGPP